jgi:phage terminase large subunit GpA-like protein
LAARSTTNVFDQLTAEQVVTRKREGRAYRVWVLPSGKRNEALDCTVLCLAAYKSAPNRRLEEQLAPAAIGPAWSGITITTAGAPRRRPSIAQLLPKWG